MESRIVSYHIRTQRVKEMLNVEITFTLQKCRTIYFRVSAVLGLRPKMPIALKGIDIQIRAAVLF